MSSSDSLTVVDLDAGDHRIVGLGGVHRLGDEEGQIIRDHALCGLPGWAGSAAVGRRGGGRLLEGAAGKGPLSARSLSWGPGPGAGIV